MADLAEVVAVMRQRAGSRQRLAEVAGVSVSAAQGWEKYGRVPEGRALARLARAYPDLADTMMAAIAPDVDPLPAAPPEDRRSGYDRRAATPVEAADGLVEDLTGDG